MDGEDGLYTVRWQLRASEDGAWLPTYVEVGINRDSGLLYSYFSVSEPYDGPTEPAIDDDQAIEVAREKVRKVSKAEDAIVVRVELTTVWQNAVGGRYVLAWSVWFGSESDTTYRRHIEVDAQSGEVLNPDVSG